MELEYENAEEAESLARALQPDNEDFIDVKTEGSALICYAEADTPLSLLHTVDDFLACLTVAEDTIKMKKK